MISQKDMPLESYVYRLYLDLAQVLHVQTQFWTFSISFRFLSLFLLLLLLLLFFFEASGIWPAAMMKSPAGSSSIDRADAWRSMSANDRGGRHQQDKRRKVNVYDRSWTVEYLLEKWGGTQTSSH